MMKRSGGKILAIDPGTRNVDVALLDGARICHASVHGLPKCRSSRDTLMSGRRLIRQLIDDFRPRVLAIERTFFARDRNGTSLNRFVREIALVGRQRGLPVVRFYPSTIRKVICGSGRAGKRDVAIVLASRYPELRAYLGVNRRWKERYHYNMFDAVALGLAVLASRSPIKQQ